MLLVPSGDLVYCMFWVGVKIFTFNTIENSGKYSNIKIKSDTLENVLVMIGLMMFLKGFSREELQGGKAAPFSFSSCETLCSSSIFSISRLMEAKLPLARASMRGVYP